jgi:RHS repeat-associated protein
MPVGATGRLLQVQLPQVLLADGTSQSSALSYEYNSAGQLAAAVTADGVRTELGYIAAGPHAGLVSEIVLDPGGANLVTKFEYDAVGFGAKVTAPGARATGVKYNALGQLEEVRAPTIAGAEGLLRRWFDDSGSVIRVERPAGSLAGFLDGMAIVDAYERDEAGCLHRATLAANTADRREWLQRVDHAGRIVAEWDPNGTHTARVFAENGALLKETAAAGDLAAQETSYSCDRAGRVVRIEDALGAVTRIEYDVWGRLHKITLPSGAMRVLEFGANDTLLEERTEELSGGVMMVRQRRRYEYDRRGRLMFTTVFSFSDDPAAAVPLTTGCIYDRDDRLREVLLPRGARHTYDFDSAGRLGQEIDARGTIRRFGYDGAGDLTQVTLTDQTGGVTRNRSSAFTFDGRGRLAQTDLLGSVERYTYDDRDLLIEQRTSSGFVRQFGFDAHGQIIERIVDPAGLSLRSAFEYDRAGRLRRYTDPMASKTVWDRDALGRPTLVTLPNETSWRYSFDTKNRIVKEQSPGGNVIEHRQTDGGGRSVHVTSLPGPGQHGAAPLDYSFDCLGRLVLAAAGPDQIRRRYDSLDRMIEESTRGKSVSTHYNDAAGWKELVYPDGRHERTEYNAAGQPERIVLTAPGSLGGATGDVLLEIVYSPPGLPSLLKYGNGVEGQIARDDHDRIIRIDYRSGATLLDSARCRYDDRGRNAVVQHLGASSHTLVHRFDASDRLVETRSVSALAPLGDDVSAVAQAADIAAARSAAATAPGAAFILDDADTRRQVVGVNGGADSATYSSSPDHRIVAAGPEIITYNPDGHRTSDSLYKYELDAFGRLVRLRDASTNSMVAELQYDALARVWSGTGDGLSFQRWFAENIPVHEASPTGAERQYSGHPLWPGFFGVIDAAGSACIHHDQGWSTTCVTDAGGTVVERHLYGAFGESAVFEADGMTPLSSPRTEARWRGMAGLGRTTLFVTPYRMYDPRLGVFTGRDPLLYLDGPSPYAFAGHNPVDFADYSGLAKTPLEDAAPRTEQPSMGEFFLDSLANLPGNPLGLLKDARTVREMVKAFKSEKNFLEGAAMALNVVNPLYHAEVARFRSGEAFDRGDKVSATALGVQAALGYVQTLGMAVGAARGLRGLLPGPVTPAAPRAPGLFTRLWHSEEGSWSGLGRSGPASAPPSATRASVPIASLGRVGQITSKQSFRRFVTRTLQDPAHPLHPLLDPATMRLRLSTRPGLTQLEWFEDPRIVEAGHYSSAKGLAGAADRLTIMSAYENRLASAIIEHPSIGGTMSEAGRVIAIGGLPVDLLTAEALMEFGALEVEVFAQAPLVIY